ncbi:bifunctional DNA-formamidopyrimidine glycosylase/DNA-(apurinic or apyrimidinic site) lyase [Luteolibacter sp. AS25]|uniref:bifunctional DNA-formamidopyrimidine glycosylase/DNA-(apurinic or apyrimidinic site) lyase n=1 Tax=Luteolibacter sp. AS25 TaxID=3135776 RepID=UPI00398A5443
MPELPEVETTRLGISPHLIGQSISEIIIRRYDLRWPITPTIPELTGETFTSIHRRSKYLILETSNGQALLIHLGMSGSLRIISPAEDWKKHDHFAISLSNGLQLRYHDPRRFGLILQIPVSEIETHKLLKKLGPEPLEETFTPLHLRTALQFKTIPIKTAIMDAKTVVGVGNIYASESLFRSRIHPSLPACKLTKPKAARLVAAIKEVLQESITQGGTTLRDFLNSNGEPGYFKQRLYVYDRKDQPCRICQTPISHLVMAQRSTYFCKTCQKP